ncbi:MAG: elongation factor G, partial [Armatimonadetes bacterium]|nr:elongation factor G [Armatimonadota bacterium]
RRKMTINTVLAPLEWKDHKINLVDTPGYPDFIGESVAALRVADAALFVVDAVAGPQVQTDKLWKLADTHVLPRLVFINRMDRENANFDQVVAALHARFGSHVVPTEIPIGQESGFRGVVDLIDMKAYTFSAGKATEAEIPDELRAEAERYREKLVEEAAEGEDALVEQYLETGELTNDEILRGLHAGVRSAKVIPVLCGAATQGNGTKQLLNEIISLFPHPAERGDVATADGNTLTANGTAPLAALVYKTMADPYVGRLSYFRVYGGSLRSDSQVFNRNKDKIERVGQVYVMRGKHQIAVPEIPAGDIGAVAKLSDTQTNDTLTTRDSGIALAPIEFPKPAISLTIEPKSKADEDKLGNALHRLAEEDPTIHLSRDAEAKQTVISGLGESHIEIVADRLKRKFNVDVQLGAPRVPYRETIRRHARAQGRYKKQTGGRGQFGDAVIEMDPLPRGEGFVFEEKIFGGAIPRQFIPAVEKGIRESLHEGIVAGYPVVDFKVKLVDGSYHDVDSSEMAFKIAGSMAFKKAMEEAAPVLLEPIMHAEVIMPDDQVGDVIGDLNAKRGRVQGMDPSGTGTTTVKAQVPMAEMLRYTNDLRSITGGRGSFEMSFSHYEEVPAHLAQRVAEDASKGRGAAAD